MLITKTKQKIAESITNLSNLGVIPAEEKQLNIDVLYNSVLEHICSVIPIDSPRQVISCLKLVYDSENKNLNDSQIKDLFRQNLTNGVSSMPYNDGSYSSDKVNCTLIPNSSGLYIASYKNILPGTVVIGDNTIIDDGTGKLINASTKAEVGTVDYSNGVFQFSTGNAPSNATLTYRFDIYNLMTNRNFVKFVKIFVEVFADLYQLDLDSALVLKDFKTLDIKSNLENILPQVLTQQIDQNIINKYFELASNQVKGSWDATVDWSKNTEMPVNLIFSDLGAYVNTISSNFAYKHGVLPNVIICNTIGYGILSCSRHFKPLNENSDINLDLPQFVGYFNNQKVILANTPTYKYNDVCIVLTYKGPSEAQSAGVYTPFIPVTFRNVDGSEGNGMITTTNVYSIAGFDFINPDLVEGIKITN